MNFQEFIKKYWFVLVVGLLLIVFVVIYAADEIKNADVKVSSLSNDGKDVVYTVGDDVYYYADDLYDDLYASYGKSVGFSTFYRAVIDKAVPTTEELTTYATNWASYILQQNDEDTILTSLKSAGYSSIDDLSAYCLASLKYDQFITDFYKENESEYITPVIEEENPRYISHILVKVADVETITNDDGTTSYKLNPTEDETAKLNAVLDALKEQDFDKVATAFSEDSTASSGGELGLLYESNKTQYVEAFYTAALEMEIGTISDVVESEYGYHIIKADAVTVDELLEDSSFLEIINNEYPNKDLELIMEKADELGYELVDENIEEYLNSYLEAE